MFKNLKKLFIVEEDVPNKKATKKPKPTKQPTKSKNTGNRIVKVSETKTPPSPPSQVPKLADMEGKVDNKFLNILFHALEKNNLEGLDYLEFKNSLKALSNMPMNEETRYKSAFAMASSMGVTPRKLIETAKFYIGILQDEEKKFQQAVAQQNQSKVGTQRNALTKIESSIQQKKEQIQRLSKEIEQQEKKATVIRKEIEQATVKVTTTKNNFIASYNAVRGQIEKDIKNMKKYLGEPSTPSKNKNKDKK